MPTQKDIVNQLFARHYEAYEIDYGDKESGIESIDISTQFKSRRIIHGDEIQFVFDAGYQFGYATSEGGKLILHVFRRV